MMADPQLGQDDGRQPPPNGRQEADNDDPAVLKAKLDAVEKQLGTLINENKRGKEDRAKLSAGLKAWNAIADEHGVEPEDLKAMLASRSEAELKSAREKGEIDTLLANQAKKYEKLISEKDERLTLAETINSAITIDATLEAELDKLKVIPALKRAAFMLHRPRAKVVSDPDARHGMRVVMEVAGDEMTVADYLKNWAENDVDAVAFLVGNESIGGGAPAGAGQRRFNPSSLKRSTMTAAQKSQFIRSRSKAEYDKLPWA